MDDLRIVVQEALKNAAESGYVLEDWSLDGIVYDILYQDSSLKDIDETEVRNLVRVIFAEKGISFEEDDYMKPQLPPGLNLEELFKLPLPDDVTMDVCRSHVMEHIVKRVKLAGVSIKVRFVLKTDPEIEAPNHMTLGEFKAMVNQGKAFISMDDDKDGGSKSLARPKELV